jgi:hypothetical protein
MDLEISVAHTVDFQDLAVHTEHFLDMQPHIIITQQ